MCLMTELERRIEQERQKVANLRSQVERAEAFIAGLEEAMKLVPPEVIESKRQVSHTPRSKSDVQKAKFQLSATGHSMHISDILKAIGKEDTKQHRASLSSSLARYARKGEVFRRDGPNEFSLIPLGVGESEQKRDTQNGTSGIDLPPIFGINQ